MRIVNITLVHIIAAIYKDRWQIELFFKALKQNLKIKTFVGTSAKALKVQVWTALIAILQPTRNRSGSCHGSDRVR